MILWPMLLQNPSRPTRRNHEQHPWPKNPQTQTRTRKSLELEKRGNMVVKLAGNCNQCMGLVRCYYFLSWLIIRSISEMADPEALVRRSSRLSKSLIRWASSPALTIMPHFTHISILSSTGRLVHFGMNEEASFVFPAPSTSL